MKKFVATAMASAAYASMLVFGEEAKDAKANQEDMAAATPVTTKDLLSDLDDETIFLSVDGGDEITWGAIRKHVDASLNNSLGELLAPAQDPMNDLRLGLYAKSVSRLVRKYLGATLIKQEAQRLGIAAPEKELDEQTRKMNDAKNPAGQFQYMYMTNAVYQSAYVEKFLKPSVVISEKDIDNLVRTRHESNLSVPATNELFRAKLEDIRGKLVRNEISWAEAAEEYSDCPDCSIDGGDCGNWEEDEDEDYRAQNLIKTCFTIPTNTVSEVIETPTAFHLVKVVSRYEPTAQSREEDGEVASADVRHIQLDKLETEPEFTKETARKVLEGRALSGMLKRKQLELMGKANIDCAIPLFRDKNSKSRAPIIAPRR